MNEVFTIVIPVYNRADVLERTLRSVAAQSWRPLRLVLVDNASTDSSAALMSRWAGEHRADDFEITIVSEPKPGAAAARNRGLDEVRSEYMLFFDSDDEMMPGAVSSYMQAFGADPALDIVMSRCDCVDAGGRRHTIGPRRGDPLVAHIHHSTLRTLGYAARTSLIRRAGGWNEQTRIWDDWELGIRLLLLTDRITAIPVTTSLIHVSQVSISGTQYWEKEAYYEAPIAAAQRVLAASTRPDAERLAALMDYRRMMLAALFEREGHPELARPWAERALRDVRGRRRLLLRLARVYIRHGGRGFDRLLNLFF